MLSTHTRPPIRAACSHDWVRYCKNQETAPWFRPTNAPENKKMQNEPSPEFGHQTDHPQFCVTPPRPPTTHRLPPTTRNDERASPTEQRTTTNAPTVI